MFVKVKILLSFKLVIYRDLGVSIALKITKTSYICGQ